MRLFQNLILIATLVVGVNYQHGYGQNSKSNEGKLRKVLSDDVKTNSKYALSIVYYSDLKAESSYLIIRNDKTKQETSLPYLLSGEDSREVWSPNEEYLVLPNSSSISMYRSASLVKIFNEKNFNPDAFYDKLRSIDRISLETKKNGFDLRHSFARWENKNSVVFRSEIVSDESSGNIELGEFRYYFSQAKLYHLTGKDLTLSKARHKFIRLYKIFGRKKKGLIYSQDIKVQAK